MEPDVLMARAERTAAAVVPEWLINVAAIGWRVLVIAALGVVLAYLATLIWTVTASIAVAVIVAAVFAPFVLRLREQGRSRNAAAGIVWAVAVLSVAGVLVVLLLTFLPHVGELAGRLQEGIAELQRSSSEADLPEWAAVGLDDAIEALQEQGGDFVGAIVDRVVGVGTILILATFLLFFFLRDGDRAWAWAFQDLDAAKRELISRAGDDALDRVGGYLRGTTLLAVVIAVTNYVFMLLLGVPLALPLAVLSFAATYIPYFGGIITTVLILLVAYAGVGTGAAVILLLLMGVRSGLVSYLLRPMIYRRTVHLHPALVLVVLPAGYQLAGVVGLFAAVPVTAVLMTVTQAATTVIEPSPPPPLPALVPAWLDRAAQWSWRILVALAVVVGVLLIMALVPLVLLPIVLAIILAATLEPIVTALVRRGRTRTVAAAASVGGSMLAIVGLLVLSLVSIVERADEFAGTTVDGAAAIDDATGGNAALAVQAVSEGMELTLDQVVAVSDTLGALGVILVLGALLTFYFLRDGTAIWAALMRHTRPGMSAALTDAGSRAVDVLGGYMLGTGAISFVGAASQWVIMVVLGLPLATPVFVLSFFGGYIPYIGSALTTLLAFLIAVAVGEPIDVVVMFIWTIVFNLVQGNIVAPLVYGRTTHIHPAVVLVSIPAASTFAGILGMFLVVPVLGIISTTWRTLLSIMSTDEGPPAEPDRPEEAPPGPAPADDAAATEMT